jgi:hypothetical protein
VRRFLCILLLISANAGAQPATAPAEQIGLDGDKLLFTPPPGFSFRGKADEDRSAAFALDDNRALISIIATPQGHVIPDDFPPKLAKILAERVREEAARGQMDIILQPRVERDPRLLLRMHDRFNTEERFGDRVQLYRGVGLYLVGVVATVYTENEDEARRIHEIAADMLLSVKLNRGGSARKSAAPTTRPVSFPNAKLRLIPPAHWRAEPADNPSGLVVTYRDPEDDTQLIMVTVRRLPPEARRDPKLREIAIDEIVSGEKQSFKMDGAEVSGETQQVPDRRFLRKTRTDYDQQGKKFRVTSRQVRAGDSVVSVTMVALEDKADAVDAMADKIALDVKPLR